MLDHAGIIQAIGPEGRQEKSKHVEHGQSSHELRQHKEHVVPLYIDRLLKGVLPNVNAERELRELLVLVDLVVIIDHFAHNELGRDAWGLEVTVDKFEEGVSEEVVLVLVDRCNFTQVD